MKQGYEQQMRKGILELVILKLIAGAPTHGYELLTAIAQRSGGSVQLRDGTLYPILYRLEDDGLVKSGGEQPDGLAGRVKPRKLYSITQKGEEALADMGRQWASFSVFVNTVLGEEETP